MHRWMRRPTLPDLTCEKISKEKKETQNRSITLIETESVPGHNLNILDILLQLRHASPVFLLLPGRI